MMSLALHKHEGWQSETANSDDRLAWHQDCLLSTVLAASALGEKAMRRLLKRSSEPQRAKLERPDQLLAALHQACHVDPEVRAGMAKELSGKFRSAVAAAAKLSPQKVADEAGQRPWIIPLMWACCQNPSPQVRQEARHLAHRAILGGHAALARRGRGGSGAVKGRRSGPGKSLPAPASEPGLGGKTAGCAHRPKRKIGPRPPRFHPPSPRVTSSGRSRRCASN